MDLLWLVPVSGAIAVLFAGYLARDVLSRDKGTPEMQDVAARIYEGAMAFLNRQYRSIAMFAVVAAVGIGLLLGIIQGDMQTAVRTGIAFLVGAACSALSGFIGMYIAV